MRVGHVPDTCGFAPGVMSRALTLLVAIVMWNPPVRAEAAAARSPNVVFVLVDDMGRGDAGCYGSEIIRTPNLDAFAAEGMKFTHAYSAGPMCSPTRASILTGFTPARLRLTDALPGRLGTPAERLIEPMPAQFLSPETETLAERLGRRGYRSAMIGKWHLGGPGSEPKDHGFDVQFAVKREVTVFSHMPPYNISGVEPNRPGQSLADRLTDEALAFMGTEDERPFFLFLSHYAVHTPLEAPEARIAPYIEAPLPPGARVMPVYSAMVEILDESFGNLIAGIGRLGLERDTLVVFTSDNGAMMGTSFHPLRGGKRNLYEGGVRVPLLARLPGVIPAGSVCETPVITTDWYRTLLRLCETPGETADERGDDASQTVSGSADGTDLTPLLTARGDIARRDLHWHFPHYGFSPDAPTSGAPLLSPSGSIRSGDLKLIEQFETGRMELFDLAGDPGEWTDLSGERPLTTRILARRLSAWRTRVSAAMPRRNPGMDPFGRPGEPWRVPPIGNRTAPVVILNSANDRHLENLHLLNGIDELRLVDGHVTAEGLANLKKLPTLRAIVMIRTPMPEGGCEALIGHPYFSSLQADDAGLTDDDMATLARIPDLRILSVSRCPITSRGVSHFRGHAALRSLTLSETLVDDATLEVLDTIPLLRQINVLFTPITAEAARAFRERHPDYNFQHVQR